MCHAAFFVKAGAIWTDNDEQGIVTDRLSIPEMEQKWLWE